MVVKTVVLVTQTVSDPMRQFVLHRTSSSSVCVVNACMNACMNGCVNDGVCDGVCDVG